MPDKIAKRKVLITDPHILVLSKPHGIGLHKKLKFEKPASFGIIPSDIFLLKACMKKAMYIIRNGIESMPSIT
jgi:hypothetical protein